MTKPVQKDTKVWPEGAASALHDCFDTSYCDIFKQAPTQNQHTDLQEHTEIFKCIKDGTVTTTRSHDWQERFTDCSRPRILPLELVTQQNWEKPEPTCSAASEKQTKKISLQINDSRDTQSLWHVIQTIMDYKPPPQACDSKMSLLNQLNSFLCTVATF